MSKITKDDWESTLRTMDKKGRDDGYVALIEDDFVFFDEDPCMEGFDVLYVTRNDVEQNIKEYDKSDE